MSILSYNQINELFNQVAIAHYQIKRFGSGELSEADINKFISENQEYPVLWMTPVSVTTNSNVLLYSLNLLVFDLVNKDKDNEREVLSDCLQIALDVVRILRYGNAEFNIVTEPNISPFAGRYSDWVAGWSLEIELEVDIQSNNCDIPYEGLDLTQVLQSFVAEGEPGFQCIDLEGCELIINLQSDVATALNNTITGGTYNSGTTNLTLTTLDGSQIIITGITSGGSSVTPNLQEVTDVGNQTNNDISFSGDGVGILFDNGAKLQKGTTDGGLGGNKGIAQICSNAYELKWEAGRLYAMEQDGFTIREVSYQFNITPTLTDDIDKGYVVGSRWILDNGDVYVCIDNSQANADWELQTICDELANCAVITGLTGDVQTIFSSITGTPQQIAYYNANGNLTGDTGFTRQDEISNFSTTINTVDFINIALHQDTIFDSNRVRDRVFDDDVALIGLTRLDSESFVAQIQNTTGNTFSGLDILETAGSFRYTDSSGNYNGFFYTDQQPGWSVEKSGSQYNYFLPKSAYLAGSILTDPNGDGQLQWALPADTGTGGGGIPYFLNLSNSQTPYREFSPIPTSGAEQTSGKSISNGATAIIAEFLTPVGFPNATVLPGGIWAFHLHSNKNTSNASFQIFAEVWKRTSGGTETLLFQTDAEPVLSTSPTINMQICDAYFSGCPLDISDRILTRVKATNTSNQTHTITLYTEGSQHYSYATTTFAVLGLTCATLSGCSVIQTIETNLSNISQSITGTPQQVTYYNTNGNLTGDTFFTRQDEANNHTTEIIAKLGTGYTTTLGIDAGLASFIVIGPDSETQLYNTQDTAKIQAVDYLTNDTYTLGVATFEAYLTYENPSSGLTFGYAVTNQAISWIVNNGITNYQYTLPSTPFVENGVLTDPGNGNLIWVKPQTNGNNLYLFYNY